MTTMDYERWRMQFTDRKQVDWSWRSMLGNRVDKFSRYALAALRAMVGLVLMQHGLQKYFGFPPGGHMAGPLRILSLFGIGGALELIGGALLAIGLFTRPVAFVLSGQMAVAYLLFHFPQAFTTRAGFFPVVNGGDLAVVLSFVLLYLSVAGSGSFSVDQRWRGKDGVAIDTIGS